MTSLAPAAPATLQTFQIGMTASPSHLSGTDRYYLELTKRLPDCGVGVRGMVIGEPEALDGGMPGIESFAAHGEEPRLRRWRASREVFRRGVVGCDVVVSHGQPHAFPVLDLMGRRPLVVQFHGPWSLEARAEGLGGKTAAIRRVQEYAIYRRATLFIALSRAFAAILADTYGASPSQIRVIPGGVDTERYSPRVSRDEARAALGLPDAARIVLSARRLEPSKGIGDLIDALPRVVASVPDAFCVVSGTGSMREELERRAGAAGLAAKVRFFGHVTDDELRLLYRAADVSVVPTRAWEGFGLSVVESLASGTPVVVSDVGGLPEVVRDLDASAIVPSGDVERLAARLATALVGEAPNAEACVAYAARFAWPSIAARVANVYREALA